MNKLILLDGTQGVGKSTAAHCVCTISNGKYVCVDPDEYFNSNVVYFFFNGGYPVANNKIILKIVHKKVREQIKDKNVVIPLTLNSHDYREVWTKLFNDIAEVRHIILYADKETLRNRINHDEGRDKELALDNIDNNDKFYRGSIEGIIKIDTSALSPEAIAKRILESVH